MLYWLEDYKRGALGPVQELEAPLLACLQAAAAEQDAWEYEQLKQSTPVT